LAAEKPFIIRHPTVVIEVTSQRNLKIMDIRHHLLGQDPARSSPGRTQSIEGRASKLVLRYEKDQIVEESPRKDLPWIDTTGTPKVQGGECIGPSIVKDQIEDSVSAAVLENRLLDNFDNPPLSDLPAATVSQ